MHKLAIRFTGSGSEYFRIWIFNLLLTFITLGLYYPWAKARRLRYFSQNTLIGNSEVGEYAMDFHGKPAAMLRGLLLGIALLVAYSMAIRFSTTAALIAVVALAAIAPVLFHAAMRFKLANTSWRGMRFRFTGTLGGAYRAGLPTSIPVILMIGLSGLLANAKLSGLSTHSITLGILIGGLALISIGLLPWSLHRIKRFQHDHYALGELETTFDARASQFYGLYFRFMLVMFAAGLAAAAVGGLMSLSLGGTTELEGNMKVIGTTLVSIVSFIIPLVLVVSVKPYLISRFQNLVWSHTRNDAIRFASDLRWAPLVKLTLKNWLLIVLTLGFYWPFAAIAQTKLCLASMAIETRDSPDEIVGQAAGRAKGAFGDAASDLSGLDIGL